MNQPNQLFNEKASAGGAGGATDEIFVPTHTVPAWGLEIWDVPDTAREPAGLLPADTRVRVLERRPDGLVRVATPGGDSTAWADGRHLQEIPADDSAAALDFVAALRTSVESYQRLLDDLAAKRIDADSFRRRAFDAGLLLRDGAALMFDLPSGRWYRYDGIEVRPMGPGRPAADQGGEREG
ncbi:SH3 domain-containing protein [Streptomyces sp. NPDC000405]|uniref:SH3 domain-containing protein n=1 Tax=Streptomyces sp. NPDC000405 TaxID=3161033 RepID=UPI00398D3472